MRGSTPGRAHILWEAHGAVKALTTVPPDLCPVQVPASLVRAEEASLRAAEGSAAQCWGGGPPPGTRASCPGTCHCRGGTATPPRDRAVPAHAARVSLARSCRSCRGASASCWLLAAGGWGRGAGPGSCGCPALPAAQNGLQRQLWL